MAPPRRSVRPSRDERRRQLLDAAVDAIRTLGPQVSMEQLAAQGGVTKPILYRHFGDREGLGRAIGEHYAAVLVARLASPLASSSPRDVLWRTIDAYLEFLEDEPQLYAFLTSAVVRPGVDDAGAIVEAVAGAVALRIGEEFRALGVDDGAVEPYAFGVVGMVHQAGDRWVRHGTMSRQALASSLTTLLWSGFEGIACEGRLQPCRPTGAGVE